MEEDLQQLKHLQKFKIQETLNKKIYCLRVSR